MARGSAHPAKRGRVRALAMVKAAAVRAEPKRGRGMVFRRRARLAAILICCGVISKEDCQQVSNLEH